MASGVRFELRVSCHDRSMKRLFVLRCLGLQHPASPCLQHQRFLCPVINVIHRNFLSNKRNEPGAWKI